MAQYEHLPIYRKAFDLTVYIEDVVKGFSRYHKYTLGTDLRNLSREVVRLIVRANSERDRLSTLQRLRDTIEELKITVRICKEVKAFKNFNLRSAILKRYGFLKEFFSFDDGRVKPLYRYSEIFPSVRSQYLYYASRFKGMVSFFQVGCFYEFYGEITDEVMAVLRLKRLDQNRRGVRYGFPLRLENEYVKRLVDKGIPVIVIRETDRYIGRIKERLPMMKIVKKEG